MNKLILTSFVVATVLSVACTSQPKPESIDRAPQARDDGSMRLDRRVLYHSRTFEGFEAPIRLVDSFKGKKLVMFGEMHGTQEMPAFVASVAVAAAKKFENVYVGLEYPMDLKPALDKFMASGDVRFLKDTKFFSDPSFHSGRGSAAMVAMLEELRKVANVKVFCFDALSKKEPRDTAMARQVLAMIDKQNAPTSETMVAAQQYIDGFVPSRLRKIVQPLVILLTGNIHSRLEPGIPGENDNAPTMGAEIIRLSEDKKNSREPLSSANILSIYFRYERGNAWNCVAGEHKRVDCGTRVLQSPPSIYTTSNDAARYYLKELEMTDGHNATVFFREVTASPPLR